MGTGRKCAFGVPFMLFKPTVADHPRVVRMQKCVFKIIVFVYVEIK
jgi:hypothetical protein